MTPVPGNHPMSATLSASQWSVILGLLDEQPHKLSAPIFQSLVNQLQTQAPPGEPQEEIHDGGS